MKKNIESKTIARITLIGLFIVSQTLFWKVLGVVFNSNLLEEYLYLQLFLANAYVLCCIYFTSDSLIFKNYWKEHPILFRVLDATLKITGYLLEMVHLSFTLLDQDFSSYVDDVKTRAAQYNEWPLLARCFLPVCLFSVLSILIGSIFGETVLTIYSEIMNFIPAVIGLIFVLANVNLDSLKNENAEKKE